MARPAALLRRRVSRRRTGSLLLSAVLLALFSSTSWAIDFPALTGRVVDEANLLSSSAEQQLTQQLQAHEEATTNQVVVVTLNNLQGLDIADYGYQLGRHWGIGQADSNNGVLLIVAPKERKVRIEVGYGLEATLTDALSKNIIDIDIVPHFKNKDYPGGIRAGVNAIVGILGGTVDVAQYQKKETSSDKFLSNGLPNLFQVLFITIIIGFILRLIFGVLLSSIVVFLGNFAYGVYAAGFVFGLVIAIFITLFFFVFSASGGRGSGGGFGGYSGGGGGFSGGGGGFSGGGGSFGGGGASGGW